MSRDRRSKPPKAKVAPWRPLVQSWAKQAGYDPDLDGELWHNDQYTVLRRPMMHESNDGVTEVGIHLSIRRDDRGAAHDWRDFQRIKNQLAGEEWEAIELYPAESRLVDTANQYHLWCFPFKLHIGWQERMVSDKEVIAGSKQRPLPPDWKQTPPAEVEALAKKYKALRESFRPPGRTGSEG